MKIGFIGYGEAAYEMSKGLNEEGVSRIVAYDPLWNSDTMGQLIRNRAQEANVELMTTMEAALRDIELLIVAVPANKAIDVCKSIIPFLQRETLYTDVSAASPKTKQSISEELGKKQIAFVDVAMMGPLSVYKHTVPMLLSGDGADEFVGKMSGYAMNIEKVSDKAGDASATKLIRSIFMKGIASLLIEMLSAAKHFKVEQQIIESVSETMNKSDFKDTLNRLVTGTAIHSERRSAELNGTLEMLQEAQLSSIMTNATKSVLDEVTNKDLNTVFRGVKPESWSEVIENLTAKQHDYKM